MPGAFLVTPGRVAHASMRSRSMAGASGRDAGMVPRIRPRSPSMAGASSDDATQGQRTRTRSPSMAGASSDDATQGPRISTRSGGRGGPAGDVPTTAPSLLATLGSLGGRTFRLSCQREDTIDRSGTRSWLLNPSKSPRSRWSATGGCSAPQPVPSDADTSGALPWTHGIPGRDPRPWQARFFW